MWRFSVYLSSLYFIIITNNYMWSKKIVNAWITIGQHTATPTPVIHSLTHTSHRLPHPRQLLTSTLTPATHLHTHTSYTPPRPHQLHSATLIPTTHRSTSYTHCHATPVKHSHTSITPQHPQHATLLPTLT